VTRAAESLRQACIRTNDQSTLLTYYPDTAQEADITEGSNCEGLGRIHHFRRFPKPGWPANPLPIDPALRSLGRSPADEVRAEVFQLAACNWRCWYCFVPFNCLTGRGPSRWVSASDLVDLFGRNGSSEILILSGGQPDLAPEWVLWVMKALRESGREDDVYLWSDDNLSLDFHWQYLSEADRQFIASYKHYGRVGCFKGFDAESFAFNTSASREEYDEQFKRFARLLEDGVDLYAYVTLTTPDDASPRDPIRRFMDRLQAIAPNLPLRTVPLLIGEFGPVTRRLNPERKRALRNQWQAAEAWQSEVESRFAPNLRALSVSDVSLARP
jgi:uncharacterized Fe-S cluster-containing radical SAM superfamily protein